MTIRCRLIPVLAGVALAAVLQPCVGLCDEADDQFNFATGLLIKKEYELAAEEFRNLLQTYPDLKTADLAYYRLGEALYGLNRVDAATEAFKKVTAFPQSTKLPQAYYRLGQLTAGSDPRAASAYYARVGERWPDDHLAEAAMYWAAEELFRAEAWDEAAQAYRRAMVAFPQGKYVAESLYSLGWSEYKAERFKAAAERFREFLQKHAEHDFAPECRLRLAESLHKLKRYDEARAAYAKVGEGEFADEAAIGAAWCLYEQKQLAAAAEAFRDAAARLGEDPRSVACLFNAGNAMVERGEFDKALAAFSGIEDKHAGHELAPEAVYWKGYCLLRLERFDEADAVLSELRSSGRLEGGKSARLLHTLAGAKFGREAYDEAAALYADLVQRFPDHELAAEAAYGQMLALEKAGDTAGAEAAGRRFFASFESSRLAHLARFALGEYRFRLERYLEAAQDFETFLAGDEHAGLADDALYKLGWCRFNLEKPVEAKEHFLAAVRAEPDGPLAAESVFMAGRASEQAGDEQGARAHYTRCVRDYGGAEYAQRSELALLLLDLNAGNSRAVLDGVEAFLAKTPPAVLADHAHVYRGEALLELGRPEQALAAYARVSKADGAAAADAAYGKAWAYRKLGRHEEAADAFSALAATPADAAVDAEFWACRSWEDAAGLDRAEQAYKAFVEAHPDSEHAEEAAYRQALCAFKAQRFAEAEALYQGYLAAHADSDMADNALYDLAWIAKEQNDAAGAEARLRRLLEQHPGSELVPDVSFRLGELAQDRKDYADAVTRYEAVDMAAIAFGDKVLYKLAWCHDYLDRAGQAAAVFRRLATDFPESELACEARYRAGKMLQKQGKYAEAIKEYASVGHGDFSGRALLHRAECLRLTEKYEAALEHYRTLIDRDSDADYLIQARLGLGHCYRALTAYQDAIDAYRAVVKATDTVDSASALLGIGYCYYAQAMYKEAVKAFLKVDILYGYESLKPEALAMVATSWEKLGNAGKATQYRDELRRRYPDSTFAAMQESTPTE